MSFLNIESGAFRTYTICIRTKAPSLFYLCNLHESRTVWIVAAKEGETMAEQNEPKRISGTLKKFFGVGDFGFNLMSNIDTYYASYFLNQNISERKAACAGSFLSVY